MGISTGDLTQAPTGKVRFLCTKFVAVHPVRGFADVTIPAWKLKILDLSLHEHENGSRWVSLPSKLQMKNGELVRGPEGKLAYAPVLEILGGREVRSAFSAACIATILAFDPTCFDINESEPD